MINRHKRASEIYKQQNTLLHRAFYAAGYPYAENKELWLPLINEIAKRKEDIGKRIEGLSGMTLEERHRLINHFQKQGMKIFAPAVPKKIRNWKKGDPDIEYEFREDGDPQVRMAYAIWAEMGYEHKTLRGLCFKLFQRDDPRWLNDEQLHRLVQVVRARAERKGCGVYYRRSETRDQRSA